MNILHKICPNCKAPICIKHQPGIEQRDIRCSQCGKTAPFFMFLEAANKTPESKSTQYPDQNYIANYGGDDDNGETHINIGGVSKQEANSNDPRRQMHGEFFNPKSIKTTPIAHIKASNCLKPFALKLGQNIIGRESGKSIANIQIPEPGEHKFISGDHLIIEVKKLSDGTYQYVVSLYKEKVNKTWVNDSLLEYGDKIVLNKDKDTIKLPNNITLSLVDIDEDKTEVY